MAEMKRIEDLDRDLCAIAMEIEEFLTGGHVHGLAAVIVMDDGAVTIRMRYVDGGKLPLVAGVTILHRDVLDCVKPRPRDGD